MGSINCWSVHRNGKSAHSRKLRAGHDGEGNDRGELDPMVHTVINESVSLLSTLYFLLSTEYSVQSWRKDTETDHCHSCKTVHVSDRPPQANHHESLRFSSYPEILFFGLLSESQPITTE